MKVCNTEAMKKIKELEAQKASIVYDEQNRSCVSYKEGEQKAASKYDYASARENIARFDEQIRKIKHALAAANCTVILPEFGITIGEALVYLAQLNGELDRLSFLASRDKLSRRITANGVLEYTECLYEPSKAEKDKEQLYSKICKLQVAIDRANLTNYIEI